MRIIFLSRGRKGLAATLGFFEISIWLFAIGQIMKNLSHIGCYIGFASGFTLGNYLGVLIEKKLAIGTLVVRIITRRDATALMQSLQACKYGVTSIDAVGATGPVKIIFTVIQRKQLAHVAALIRDFHPKAFYSVEEVREAASGIFPAMPGRMSGVVPRLLRPLGSMLCLRRTEEMDRPAAYNGGAQDIPLLGGSPCVTVLFGSSSSSSSP
jgi:uncharacterized protein YebE (UPF0316 family)